MANWRDNLRPASFKGVSFEVASHADEGGRRAQIHEYPNRDEPFAEDLGKMAETLSFEAFVIGDDYMDKRDALREALNSVGPGTLTHPTLGDLYVICTGFRIAENTGEGRLARFSLTFMEAGEQSLPADAVDYKDLIGGLADTAQANVIDGFLQAFDLAGQATAVVTEVAGVVETFAGNINEALEFVNSALTFGGDLWRTGQSALSSATDIFGRGLDAVDIMTSVINWIGGIKSSPAAVLSEPRLLASAVVSGLGVINTFSGVNLNGGANKQASPTALAIAGEINAGLNPLAAIGRLEADVIAAQSVRSFLEPAEALRLIKTATDLGTEEKIARIRNSTAKSAAQVELMRQADALVACVGITEQARAIAAVSFTNTAEAEAALADFVAYVDNELLREMSTPDDVYFALKDLQAAVVKDIAQTIRKLPEVRGVTVSENTPAVVLAYDLYGDAARADEIVSRNRLRRPGFVPAHTALEVLAA